MPGAQSPKPKLYDISPALTPEIAVFPGDTPLTREVLMEMKRGDNITLSTLHSTVHVGAHADGPNHYGRDGRAIDEQPLDRYLGPCQVVRVVDCPRGGRFGARHLGGAEITQQRVLFATGSYPDSNHFNQDFCAVDPEFVDFLAARGVITVGVDTPSVDTADSKNLPAHRRIFEHDIAILEGLRLDDVPPGEYELIALPLNLVGFDASPVRAVLRALR